MKYKAVTNFCDFKEGTVVTHDRFTDVEIVTLYKNGYIDKVINDDKTTSEVSDVYSFKTI